MPRSASVRLLDGKHRSVNLDGCEVLATTNNPIVALVLDRLAARLTECHGVRHPALEPRCAMIPRAIHRDTDGLPFAEVTTRFGLGKASGRSVFLEVPGDAMADVLARGGFDADTAADWTRTKPGVPRRPKSPRDRGLTARCLEDIQDAFRQHGRHPSYTDLKRRCGCKTLRSPAAAYDRFYRSDEYQRWIKDGGEPWGPGASHA